MGEPLDRAGDRGGATSVAGAARRQQQGCFCRGRRRQGAGAFARPHDLLIVDPFTPRSEPEGVCANLNDKTVGQYFTRGGNDALAALNVLKAMPDIDAKHIFLQGYSFGAISSLSAIDTKNAASHEAKVAGVIAYYPYCYDGVDPSVPVLVMIGEKDDWTPAAKCQAVTGKTDFEVVVYPGDTHGFTMPMDKPVDYLGHHIVYDEKATQDGQQRADAFIAAHMK